MVQSVSILLGLGDDLRLSQEKTLPATDRRRLAVFDAFIFVVELVAVVDNEDLRRGRCVSEMSPLLVRREEDTFILTADDTDTFAVDVLSGTVPMEWIDLRRVEVFI